jgi:signal recognition particle subunit SRP54
MWWVDKLVLKYIQNQKIKIRLKLLKMQSNMPKQTDFNVVIVDTAGRLAVDEQMMNEIANVHKAIQPHETLFVVDAMTGQDAVNTAKAFNDRLNFDGVILTKLDGDTRGGAAIID